MADTYDAKQAEIELVFDRFAHELGMPGHAIAYAKAIARSLWEAFPKCTRWHAPEVFAEVLAFHAMKAAGMAMDQAAFRRASAIGDMVMTRRHWLLQYMQYLPPALRVTRRDPGIEPYLARIGDDVITAEARAIHERHEHALAGLRPSMRTGVCVLLAMRSMPGLQDSKLSILSRAGINMASAINAVKRIGILAEDGFLKIDQYLPTKATT